MNKFIIFLIGVMPLFAFAKDYGVQWECTPSQIIELENNLVSTLKHYNLSEIVTIKKTPTKINAYISNEYAVGGTLHIAENPLFNSNKEYISKNLNNKTITREITSKKEILISLLFPGRLTKFDTEPACSASSLEQILTIRQNTVFWTSQLEWGWPDGGSAGWNEDLWVLGTPKKTETNYKNSVIKSFNDLYENQQNYKIGCYTATKANIIQSFLDFYNKSTKTKRDKFFDNLLSDDEPFVGIEPSKMWYFEDDFSEESSQSIGKLLSLQENVESDNFIPGDWVYIRNTDHKTNTKTGYEGSNTIYLGGGIFSDYYSDHGGGYPYERKLDEVYQWRNGVFSRSRDVNKIQKLSPKERFKLTLPPEQGGLVESYRIIPLIF